MARVNASSSLRWMGAYRCVPRHCSSKRQACRSVIPYCSRARSTAQRRRSGLRSFPRPRPSTPASPATTHDAFVFRTRFGGAMRATAQDREAATFMGIDVDRVILVTFFVASALAGMGGVLFGLRYASVDFFMGYLLGIKAFTAAVIGGIGNIRGAMVGGLLLGVLESLVGGFISSQFQDTFVFLALITVLLIRPQGLFGQPLADRA